MSEFKRSSRDKRKEFTMVPNEAIRNYKITNSAFRLLCYLQSNLDTMEFVQEDVLKELGWGHFMMISALKNLKECKHLVVTRGRGKAGKFVYLYDFDWEEITEEQDSNNFTSSDADHGKVRSCLELKTIKGKHEKYRNISVLSVG